MTKCKNCGCALDPQRTATYHRETFYCNADETGRVSVACATIRNLQDTITLLRQDNRRLKMELENVNTEENRNGD